MASRRPDSKTAGVLLDLIERRFGLRLSGDAKHLRQVREHYDNKRELLLWQHGIADVLVNEDYAKAVLISETARLMLREIDPWPRRKKPQPRNR